MKVFELTSDVENYQILVPANENDYDGSNLWVTGKFKLTSWQPPILRWSEKEHESETAPDIARINPAFYAFNSKATQLLHSVLTQFGELLPFELDGEAWTAFNPTTCLDVLDHTNTVRNQRPDGKPGRFIKTVINSTDVPEIAIFQIPEKRSALFVTEAIENLILANKLTGITFTPSN